MIELPKIGGLPDHQVHGAAGRGGAARPVDRPRPGQARRFRRAGAGAAGGTSGRRWPSSSATRWSGRRSARDITAPATATPTPKTRICTSKHGDGPRGRARHHRHGASWRASGRRREVRGDPPEPCRAGAPGRQVPPLRLDVLLLRPVLQPAGGDSAAGLGDGRDQRDGRAGFVHARLRDRRRHAGVRSRGILDVARAEDGRPPR